MNDADLSGLATLIGQGLVSRQEVLTSADEVPLTFEALERTVEELECMIRALTAPPLPPPPVSGLVDYDLAQLAAATRRLLEPDDEPEDELAALLEKAARTAGPLRPADDEPDQTPDQCWACGESEESAQASLAMVYDVEGSVCDTCAADAYDHAESYAGPRTVEHNMRARSFLRRRRDICMEHPRNGTEAR